MLSWAIDAFAAEYLPYILVFQECLKSETCFFIKIFTDLCLTCE